MRALVLITSVFFSASTLAHDSKNKKHYDGSHSKQEKKVHEGSHSKNEKAAAPDKTIKAVKLTGNLIGLTCYVRHDSHGEDHKSCAKECAEKGLPIGLLSKGTIYQVSGHGHSSLVEAYKPLLPYLEDKVEVEGTLFEKQGIRLLTITKVKKSKS